MVRTSIRALKVAAVIFGSLLTLKGELCGSVRGVVVRYRDECARHDLRMTTLWPFSAKGRPERIKSSPYSHSAAQYEQ